ncbi:glutathione S-transferase [Ralstonia pseudosolanacearum]|uniref:glutathione S-transferase n=1 Tax=Ralstonia pseudosolanacearum TaxID=1310165 RepID=UPI003CE6873C
MAGNGDVKVLGAWPSPFAHRPRIALHLKDVDYVYVEENLASKSELLIKSNPIHKKVPVLIHNGNCVSESLVIVEYIDEVFSSGHSLLPSDAYDRAISRFWAAYIDSKWFGSLRGVVAAKTEEERKAAVEEVATGMGLLEEAFEKMSKGKGFFGGERIGYLDIAFGSCLAWMRVAEELSNSKFVSEAATPGIHGWAERFASAAAVKDVLPETEKLLGYAEARFGAKAF